MNFPNIRSWSLHGSTAVIDQGLYSGSNFILNVFLARWLAPINYGAFAVAFTVFLFLSSFHNALLLEPMSVLGPGRYSHQMDAYLFTQIRLHFALTLPLAVLMTLAGIILPTIHQGSSILAKALIGSGLALPFLLLLWTVRRMFYVLKRPANAMFSSSLYALLLGAGALIMHFKGMDSSLAAFVLMGSASLLSSVLAGGRLLIRHKRNALLPWSEIIHAHWNFGKWVSAAAILNVAVGQSQTFVLAGLIGLEAAGAFRAMQNFILPISQIVTAIAVLGLPALAYEYGQGNLRNLRQKGLFITLVLTGMAIAYGIFIWGAANPLEQLVYAGKYAAYVWLIPLFALIPVFTALSTGFSLILRSIQRPQIYLIGGIVNMAVGLPSVFLLVKNWGIAGAVTSLAFTYFIGFVVMLYLYKRWLSPLGLDKAL